MSAGKILATLILSLLTGAILGALIYNRYYYISEKVLTEYNFIVISILMISMFVVGVFVGKSTGGSRTSEYKPMFQGRPQQLGKDGEKIVMASLKRAGIVKER